MMREAEECYAMAISCDPSTGNITVIVRIASCCWRFEDAAADFRIASRSESE